MGRASRNKAQRRNAQDELSAQIQKFREVVSRELGIDLALLLDSEVQCLTHCLHLLAAANGIQATQILVDNAAEIREKGLATFYHRLLDAASNVALVQLAAQQEQERQHHRQQQRQQAFARPNLLLPNGKVAPIEERQN